MTGRIVPQAAVFGPRTAFESSDDVCDCCLTERYPGPLPESPAALFAPGWYSIIHPFACGAPPTQVPVSLCCPKCSAVVLRALGYKVEG